MKEMNRREFLTLTGAAVVTLSLAGCGGGSSAPAVPTGKEAELVTAINKVWKEKFVAGQVDHEQLTLNQDAVDAIRCYGRVFEEVNETPHKLTSSDFGIVLRESGGLAEKLKSMAARTVWQELPASPNRLPRRWWLWKMSILARILPFGFL